MKWNSKQNHIYFKIIEEIKKKLNEFVFSVDICVNLKWLTCILHRRTW